jgi:hypothetical protein
MVRDLFGSYGAGQVRSSRSSMFAGGRLFSRSTVTSDSPFGLKFSVFPLFLVLVRQDRKATERGKRAV